MTFLNFKIKAVSSLFKRLQLRPLTLFPFLREQRSFYLYAAAFGFISFLLYSTFNNTNYELRLIIPFYQGYEKTNKPHTASLNASGFQEYKLQHLYLLRSNRLIQNTIENLSLRVTYHRPGLFPGEELFGSESPITGTLITSNYNSRDHFIVEYLTDKI